MLTGKEMLNCGVFRYCENDPYLLPNWIAVFKNGRQKHRQGYRKLSGLLCGRNLMAA